MTDLGDFVGKNRERLVQELLQDFVEAKTASSPRCILITGPPGAGKTRIVQEFFERLPRRAGGADYWPPGLFAGDSWQDARKSLQPEGDSSRGSATWLWWAIECHERAGKPAQSLFDDRTRLDRQIDDLPRQRVLSILWNGIEWTDIVGTVVSIGAFTLGWLIDTLLYAASAVALLSVLWRRRAVIRRAWRSLRGDRDQEWKDNARYGRRNEVEQLADKVVGASRHKPTVIVIDDVHSSDETLNVFVQEVLQRPKARILIIACGWPTGQELKDLLGDTAAAEQAERVGLVRHIDLSVDAPLLPADVRLLLQTEIRRQGVDPSTIDPHVYDTLVAKAEGNALAAVAQLQSPRARGLIQEGMHDLQSVEDLPTGLDDITRSYWRSIPRQVRSALALAALVGRDFPDEPVVAGIERGGGGPGAPLLDEADGLYRVVRAGGGTLRRFVDHLYLREASEDARDEELVPDSAREALVAEIHRLAQSDELLRTPLVREVILSAHVQLALEGAVSDRASATNSAVQLGLLYETRSGFTNALRCAVDAERLDPETDDSTSFRRRVDHIRYLRAVGESEEAFRRATTLRDLMNGRHGTDHPDSIIATLVFGEAGIASGRHREMLAPLVAASDAAGPLPAVEAAVADRLATQIAECHSRSGDFARAAEILEALAERRGNGTSLPAEAVTAKLSALKIRLRSGHDPRVVDEFRDVIRRAAMSIGTDHPQTLRARLLLVEALVTYRSPEACSEARATVAHAGSVRPSRHVDVMRARIREAEALVEMGSAGAGLRTAGDTHRLTEQVLGRKNPNTVRALGVLVDARIRGATVRHRDPSSGEWGEIELSADDLVERCTSTFGHDNADTLGAHRRRAQVLLATRRLDEAVELLHGLLVRTSAIRGPEHPDTLRTRSLLLLALEARDGSSEALRRDLEQLIADCRRTRGADHPMCDDLRTMHRVPDPSPEAES